MKEKIDIATWERKDAFAFFSKYSNPYGSATTIINVDNLVNYAHENKISFYGIMTYVVLKTINEIDEYKYVLEDGDVYKYNQVNVSFTVLQNNHRLNFSRTVPYNDFDTFIADFIQAKYEAENNLRVPSSVSGNNKIYITCLPWMRATSISNPQRYDIIDSIPRICWGKYFLENGEYKIDISIQIHHAFQDGYHVGYFINALENNISKFAVKDNGKKYRLYRP